MIVSILAVLSVTSSPRLDSKFLSGFVLEYSILTFSLILSNSASVTLLASDTATLSACATSWISYFWVCGLRTTTKEPGSSAPVAFPVISPPSASVARKKRHPKTTPGGFSPLVAAFSLSCVKFPSGAGVPE